MEQIRKPFQGVWNIIRFNRHFYIAVGVIMVLSLILNTYTTGNVHLLINIGIVAAVASILVSLLVSWYVFDLSPLYQFNWIDEVRTGTEERIVNINAGFDETSVLLHQKFPDAQLAVYDFYDPAKHTEVSIKRARKAYPSYRGTIHVSTNHIPLEDKSADKVFVIFAAHEIRDFAERSVFFAELKRILKKGGEVIVTEHLRDVPNFLAYNIGFFHFMPHSSWQEVFLQNQFRVEKEIKNTPFVSTFILKENGSTS